MENAAVGNWTKFDLGTTTPGLMDFTGGSESTKERFDQTVIIERCLGSLVHDAGASSSSRKKIIPLVIAGCVYPQFVNEKLTGDDLPNPFFNEDQDDYFMFYSHHCQIASGDLIPSEHIIDSKAKRKVEVGDVIRWLGAVFAPTGFPANIGLEITLNVRLLWKLKV